LTTLDVSHTIRLSESVGVVHNQFTKNYSSEKTEDPILTFFFTSISNTNSASLFLSEENPLDQSHIFTDASLPPETRNLPFSPNAENALLSSD